MNNHEYVMLYLLINIPNIPNSTLSIDNLSFYDLRGTSSVRFWVGIFVSCLSSSVYLSKVN